VENHPQDIPAHRILVVDDEHIIADTLAIILRQNGFDAAVAYNGLTAIEKARTWHPDLLLSDLVMPDTDGIEAASQILRFLPDAACFSSPGRPALLPA
jgi:CheY-like chemotaxis protein